MLDLILKAAGLVVNAINIVLKIIELRQKMKFEHQKSNHTDQS